jgi:hypothetical protein
VEATLIDGDEIDITVAGDTRTLQPRSPLHVSRSSAAFRGAVDVDA